MTTPAGEERAASAEASSETPRIAALDGLRGIAIALVLVHHYAQGMPIRSGADRALAAVANSTWIGVDLFFVLSGFLITGILLDAKGRASYFRSFYARRTLRIFPIYYLLLAVLYFVLPWFGHALKGTAAKHSAWFWLYGSNILTARSGWPDRPVAHLWSLSIEEHFYLLWPALVLWLRPRALLLALLGMILGAAGLRVLLLHEGCSADAVFVLTPCRIDSLAMGGLLTLAVRDPGIRPKLARAAPWLWWLGCSTIYLTLAGEAGLHWPRWSVAQHGLGYGLIALTFAGLHGVMLGVAPSHRLFVRCLSAAPLRKLGQLSYGVYLYHLPLESAARSLGLHPVQMAERGSVAWPWVVAYMLGNALVAILVAWLSWHAIEARLLALKRHFVYGGRSG
jgi:peptidoglycan/LPS O-acetylase OafA/YrhL